MPDGRAPGEPPAAGEPWVPDEAAPASGWPPAPNAVPLIVSEWERASDEGATNSRGSGGSDSGGGSGSARARPRRLTTPRPAVALKDDLPSSRERIRRFTAAWRWLIQAKTQATPSAAALERDECDRRLAGAGVLLQVRSPGRLPGETRSPGWLPGETR